MPTTTTTKFAPAINTAATPAPTLKSALDKILTELVVEARAAAILLSEHRRKFDREPECEAVLSRASSILHDASVQLSHIGATMSAETRAKLNTPR